MKNKNGEISTATIIGLLVLIASFVAILILFFNLNLGKISDQQLCHTSVIARSSAILAANELKGVTSLNCKTQYICLSKDGTCEEMTSPEIEKVKSKEEVYEILATQLANCWWMFGEGKVDYVGKEFLDEGSLYCSLCSQIVFDDSLISVEGLESGEINKEEFYQYLDLTSDPKSNLTYWDYLYEKTSPEDLNNAIKQEGNYDFGKINFNNRYYVTMGIISDSNALLSASLLAGTGVAFAIGSAALIGLTGGVAIPAVIVGFASIVSGSVLGGVTYFAIISMEGESGQQFLRPTIVEASDDFKLLNCKDTNTIS